MCFRKQFLRKIWPIQLAFRLFIVWRIFVAFLTLCSSSSFLARSVHHSKLSGYFRSTLLRAPSLRAPHAPNESVLWPQYLFLCTRWFVVSAHRFQITVHKFRASEFRNLASFVYGSSVWNFLRDAVLAPKILRWLLCCASLLSAFKLSEA
jgi:hypothetical protein